MSTENCNDANAFEEGFRRLEALIYVFGINKEIWGHVDEFFVSQESDATRRLSLLAIINGFELSKRVWDVLEKRHGFSKHHSLDEVAVDLGVTRERVRQIELRGLAKVERRISSVISPLLWLDRSVQGEWLTLKGTTSINEAIFLYQRVFLDSGWDNVQGREIRQLLILIRALVYARRIGIDRHLPNLSYAACSLTPIVLRHPKVAENEDERKNQQKELERKWTYEELTEAVLTDANIPLHYTEIAQRAEKLGRRDSLHLKGIHNVLLSNPDKFAYVDQGTYGLTTWGLTSVDAYNDIIAEAMIATGRALSYGDILQSVISKRSIKQKTLQMTLDMHPRFYCSQEGTYGLRAWLLPRNQQTLRTPKWQVETLQSYERVERSIEHGYNVDLITAQDN